MEPNKSEQNLSGQDKKKLSDSEYRFMDQVIRKKPVDWKKIVIRFLWIIISGVLIGLIAAAVLVRMVPELRQAYASHKSGGMISIQKDEKTSAQESVTALSASSSEEVTEAESRSKHQSTSEDTSDGENAVSDRSADSGSDTASSSVTKDRSGSETGSSSVSTASAASVSPSAGAVAADSGITLEEYSRLYSDMMDIADKSSGSLVKVTGISSETDYFQENITSTSVKEGLIIAENSTQLYILTEYRAIQDAETIQVTFSDDATAEAHFRKQDPNTGLCIIYVPLDQMNQTTLNQISIANLGNSYIVTTGQPVLALGSPAGYSDSVAFGAVTSVSGTAFLTDCTCGLLTTDIKGSAEGSGVLINLNGDVVGIIDQSLSADNGETVICLSISDIKSLIEELSNNEPIPYVGIRGQDVTDAISRQNGMPEGLLVTSVDDNSPAMLSGIKVYDVITDISGTQIHTFKDYQNLLNSLSPGEVVTVSAMRKGADGYEQVSFSTAVSER